MSALIYFTSCVILIAFGEAVSRSERRLQTKQHELERESAERRSVEDELRASRRREQERRLELEALMGSAPASIWVAHDRDCLTITGNPAACAMLGVPAGTNLSRSAPSSELVPAYEIYRDGSPVLHADLPMQTAARTAAAVSNQELEFRFQDGRPSVWAYGNVEPLFDHRGLVRGAIGTFVDITERRRAEELQRETEGRFRTLADQAPVLIWLNNLDGCEYVNREYLRFVGAGLDEVRGLGWSKWVHPDDFEEYAGAYRRALENREPFDAQFRFRSAAGDYRWMKSAGLPRLTADGSLVGFVGCSFDITDVKEAIDTLQESDRRKDEFLATLAHELRNPLAPLRNGLGILRAHRSTASARRAHARRDGAPARAAGAPDRRPARRQPHQPRQDRAAPRAARPAAAVAEAAAVARPLLEADERELTVELAAEPVVVDADGTRLAQVVANLLDNAAKYTERGGHIRLAVERRDGEAVDQRRGRRHRHSAPRCSAASSRCSRRSIARSSARRAGSASASRWSSGWSSCTAARSRPSEAPAAAARSSCACRSRRAAHERAAELAPSSRAAATPPRRRVLVVDDNRDAADSLAAMLRLMGHEVETRARRVAALETAASVPARRRAARHRHARS